MKALFEKYKQRLLELYGRLTESFSRLSEQEKIIALGATVVVLTLSLVGGTYALMTSIDRTTRQIAYKSQQLREIIAMRDTFKRAQEQSAAFRSRLQRNEIRLVALIEDEAKKMGVEVSNLTPHGEGEATPSGIKTLMVDVRAQKLSADKLVNFLQKLEEQPSPVRILKLKVNNRFDEKDLLDAEMTVATYKAG